MVVPHAGAVSRRRSVSTFSFCKYQLLTSNRFYWLEKSRDASPQAVHASLPDEHAALSSSKLSSSSIPFSSSQMFSNLNSVSFSQSPGAAFSQSHSHFGGSPRPFSLHTITAGITRLISCHRKLLPPHPYFQPSQPTLFFLNVVFD